MSQRLPIHHCYPLEISPQHLKAIFVDFIEQQSRRRHHVPPSDEPVVCEDGAAEKNTFCAAGRALIRQSDDGWEYKLLDFYITHYTLVLLIILPLIVRIAKSARGSYTVSMAQ